MIFEDCMRLLLLFFLVFSSILEAEEINTQQAKLETVNLQLKWFHQFQFAGYYAAKAKGYYQDAGLAVNFIERSAEINVVRQVVSGATEYGIEDAGLLIPYANGEPIRALAAIFQHNPFIFASKQSSGIVSPYEMLGKRIMFGAVDGIGADEVPLMALFAEYGVKENLYTHITPSFNFTDLAEDKIDVMSGYITDLPYYFQQQGIKINIINPLNYGIDFYGDLLFTSEKELKEHPDRANRFLKASLKGWQYALENSEEIIQLIHGSYSSRLNLDALRYEAKQIKRLILADSIPLGEIRVERLKQVANIHAQLKLAPRLSDEALENFINFKSPQIQLSASEINWLQAHLNLNFIGDKNALPYGGFDESEGYTGIAADYLQLIEKQLGIVFNAHYFDNKSDYLEAYQQGKVDVSLTLNNQSLKDNMLFTQAFHSSPYVIVMHKSTEFVEGVKQISDKKIALVKSNSYAKVVLDKFPNLKVLWVDSVDEALSAVATNQADATIACLTRSVYAISKLGLNNLRVVGKTKSIHHLKFAVHKNIAALVPLINRALDGLSEAEKQSIVESWGEEKYTNKLNYQLILIVVLAALLITAGVILWNRRLMKELVKRKKIEAQLNLASAVYQNTAQAIMVVNPDNLIVDINPAFTELTGYLIEDVRNEKPSILKSDRTDATFYAEMWKSILTTGKWQGEIWNTKKNSEEYVERLLIDTVFNSQNEVLYRIGMFTDITAKKQAEEKVWLQANFDQLTGLPNRHMFSDRLNQDIKLSKRSTKPLALLFIDLDHFKEVNDSLGHEMGDLLLTDAAQRIHRCIRSSDTVARIGGDEFTVVLAELESTQDVERIAQAIIENLVRVFNLGVEEAYISASVGIALYPDDASTVADLVRYADQAMYQAKSNGRNQFHFFTAAMQECAQMRHQLKRDLHSALANNELELYYQPIVNFQTGKIEFAEALLRWNHPLKGVLPAAEFIALAEESALIADIGTWAFKQVVKQLKQWGLDGADGVIVSVNKSLLQFRSAEGCVSWIDYLREQAVDPSHLLIEVEDNQKITNNEKSLNQLLVFKNEGVRIVVDSLGVGDFSLSSLNAFEADYLKIKRHCIEGLAEESKELALCEAIIVMAHKLGLKVIAEGVETDEQQRLLIAAGCDYGQGYLYAKALPVERFEVQLNGFIANRRDV